MTQPKTTAAKTAAAKTTRAPSKASAAPKPVEKDIAATRTKVAETTAAETTVRKSIVGGTALRHTGSQDQSEASASAPVVKAAMPAAAAKVPTVTSSPVRVGSPGTPKTAPAAKVAAKPAAQRNGFRTGEFVVYPAHGVGHIVAIEEQEVAGFKLELFVVSFLKDKMTLRVPTSKVASVGLRKLADADVMQRALDTLTGRARIKRTMWSRRAQEYEAKINSGDLVAIAEVVRDLYRSDAQPEQSYSERQLYEAALDRMARETAAVQKLTESESLKLIDSQLQRGPRRGPKTESDGAADADDGDLDGDIEEAA